MELNKLNISSIFGEKMNQIDFISGLVTDKNTPIAPSNTENGIQTETINLSGEIEDIKTPSSPGNIGNNAITKNTTNNSGETRNYSSSYGPQQQTTNISDVQQNTNGNITNEVNSNGGLNLNSTNGATTTESGDNKSLGASKGTSKTNQSQVVKITEEKEENEKTASAGGTSGSSGRGNTSVESEGKTSGEDKITKIGNKTTEKEEETKEENTKMESKTSGQKIKEDLSKRTQYEYDVEENARKDEVDSAMQNMGVQEGEYEKYIKILETTINSEEQHIQFTKDNDKRLAELYGKKDSATGEYTNAKELLDIINSDDPKKEIKYLPLTGEDGEKATKEIWEEKYEEAKEKYKDNEIFQKDTYESLSAEEKIKFVKELTKEEIKEAYKEEREQVYEDYQEIDIEGNVGGLGLYKKEDFDDLTEKEKIEFIGRYNNKKYTQLTFSVDDMKEWNEDIDEKALEGMSDSIVDRETSVKQLKYLKKEAEMQKDIYQYEKVVYTEDYKNYTEKGTKGYEDKKKYLNSEQNKILDYIYNEQGKEKADEYIKALRGQIAKGQGIEQANEFLTELESDPEKMNKFMEVMKDADKFNKCLKEGFIDGVGTFGEGIKNFFTDDYELSALEWKEQAILEVLSNNTEYSNGWCDKAYQYGNVVGNLAPSMLTTAAVTAATGGAAAPEALSFAFTTTGELAGTLAMTISAAGSSKHQALMNGADTTEAWAYGICSGLSESTMERFLGSIPGLSKLEGGYFKKMISEGLEEGSQEFVTAALNSVILDEDVNIDDVISQAKESFTMGASVSALLNISALKKTKIKLKYKGETVEISENARAKIEEEITKVNEGSIDAETGNKNALEILEKELNKKGKVKEEIKADDIENIEIKGSKEKVDSTKSKEKIEIEGDKEKASKELSSIEDKIRIASEDIKKINKQEKQEKKESKELEKQLKKQKEVKLTESVNKEQNTILKNIDVTENVENVLKGDISIVKSAIGTVMSVPGFFGRFIYKDISQNKTLIDHTVENGLYHLTTADGAQKIIESGYVKASSATTSYGAKKAFFFSGVPSVQNVALNMDNIPSKITAVKINTDVEQLVTPNFKYRPDDAAIVHKGNYEIKNDAEIKYLCLVNKGGKLQYQEVPKNVYDSYNVNIKASKLKALAIAYQNYSDFFFNKHNSDIVRNINVDIDSKLDNNIINFDTKKRSIKDLNVDKLKEIQKSSKNYLYDSNIEIDPSTIEMENVHTAPMFDTNQNVSNANSNSINQNIGNTNSFLNVYQISEEYKPYHKLEELLTSPYKKYIGNVLTVSTTQEGLDNLMKKAGDQIEKVSKSTTRPILVTDALLRANVKSNVPNFSRQYTKGNYLGVTLDPNSTRQMAIHEFGHLKSEITQFEAYKIIEDKIINFLSDSNNQEDINNEYENKMYYTLKDLKRQIINEADIVAKKQLNYDNIDFDKLTDIEKNELNEKRTKLRLEEMDREGLISTLDIFDAIYSGRVYEDLGFGHGAKYYSKTSNICEELIANYSVLYAQNNVDMLNLLPRFVNDAMAEALNIIDTRIDNNKKSITLNEIIDNMLSENKIDEAYNVSNKYKDALSMQKVSKKSLEISEAKLKIGDYDNAIKYATMSNDTNQINKVAYAIYGKIGDLLGTFNSKEYNEAKKLANQFFRDDPEVANLISGYTALQNGDIKNAMMYFDVLQKDNVRLNFYKNIFAKAQLQFYEAINRGDIGTAKNIASLIKNKDFVSIVDIYENAYGELPNKFPEVAVEAAQQLGGPKIIKDVNRIIKNRADQAFKNGDYKLASELADTINYKRMQRKLNRKLKKIGSNMTRVDTQNINQAVYDQTSNFGVQQQAPYKTVGPEKDSFVALSDMHGANWVMDKVVNKYLNQYETIYNLGDIIDRGEKPFDLLLKYMELSKKYPDRVMYIPGNHDSFLYGFYRGNEQVRNQSRTMIQLNKLTKTYEQAEAYRIAHPQKFEEMLNWLGSQPLQKRIEKGGQKYAMAHALFNQKIYDQNPNYSLNDYINDGANVSSDVGNILWFRKGQSSYDPSALPESDVIMIVGHTPNATDLDLNGVRVIDVDGAAHKVNKDGTYSTRKYTGGDDYEVTVRLDDQTSEMARINNFNANFQNIQPMQNYGINREYTIAQFDISNEISNNLNQSSKTVEKGNSNDVSKVISPDNIQFFDSKNKYSDLISGLISQKNGNMLERGTIREKFFGTDDEIKVNGSDSFTNLVLDDVECYYDFLNYYDSKNGNKKEAAEPYKLGLIDDFIDGYFSKKENSLPSDEIRDQLYIPNYLKSHYGGVSTTSIKYFKNKGIAECAEKAALAHNLARMVGIDSRFIMGKISENENILSSMQTHAYNIIKSNTNDVYILYDPHNPIRIKEGTEEGKKLISAFSLMAKDDYIKFINNGMYKFNYDYTIRRLQREYNYDVIHDYVSYNDRYYGLGILKK